MQTVYITVKIVMDDEADIEEVLSEMKLETENEHILKTNVEVIVE